MSESSRFIDCYDCTNYLKKAELLPNEDIEINDPYKIRLLLMEDKLGNGKFEFDFNATIKVIGTLHIFVEFKESRNHIDKNQERDNERLSFGGVWTGPLHHGTAMDSRGSGKSSNNIDSGLIFGGAFRSSIYKVAFQNDFSSLGTEQRQLIPKTTRVSSPDMSSYSQNLSVGNSTLIDMDGWALTLAESPGVVRSSSTNLLLVPLTVPTSVFGAPSVTSGLNMAVALVQVLSQACTASQLSIDIQRCEELAIKQSRQLILVTPSMPNDSVLNPEDISKVKPILRTSEVDVVVKNGQQQFSFIHNGNQSPNSGHVKFDLSKTLDKLLVFKPRWENETFLNFFAASDPHISSSITVKSQVTKEVVSASLTTHANGNGTAATSNGEQHMQLLTGNMNIQDGVDVKEVDVKVRIKGVQSKFINVLVAENSALQVKRGK
ncbi:hypothetical protein GQ457_11G033030 [Hibiscus cannabinus]